MLVAIGLNLLSSHTQRRGEGRRERERGGEKKRKKKLDILLAKIKLAPRKLLPLVSRSSLMITSSTPDFIQRSLSFLLYPFFLSYLVLGS